MNRFIAILLVMSSGLWAQLPTIAVLDLSSKSLQESDVKAISVQVAQEIFKSGYFEVLERADIAKVLQEQGLAQTGAVKEEEAIGVGKLIGAKKMLCGSVEAVDRGFIENLRIIDVESGRTENMVTYNFEGDVKDLIVKGAREAVNQLIVKIGGARPVELQFVFIATRKEKTFQVCSGDTVRTGDRIHIMIKPNQRCYVYIVNQDAAGNVYCLFPNTAQRYKALEPDAEYHVPGEGMEFELDSITGKESVFITASTEPLTDIEKMIFKTDDAITEKKQVLASIRTRGMAEIVKGDQTVVKLEKGNTYHGLSDLLTGTGTFRHIMGFFHVPNR
jgi:hypothetical protein